MENAHLLVLRSKNHTLAKMAQNGPKWHKMPKMAQNDPKWSNGPKRAQNGPKMAEGGGVGAKGFAVSRSRLGPVLGHFGPVGELAQNGQNGPQMAKMAPNGQNGPK